MAPGTGSRLEPRAVAEAYRRVRAQTLALVDGLSPEDCMVQSMAEASPVKWHLAHVTWFFETLVLEEFLPRLGRTHIPFDPQFRVLFNSYYNGIGAFHPQPRRGVLSRPSLQEVLSYRASVDERILHLLQGLPDEDAAHPVLGAIELGLHHEQQHQELILTDIKHHFSCNPVAPALRAGVEEPVPASATRAPAWIAQDGGKVEIGHRGPGFAFDNEMPAHHVWVEPCEIAQRLVTNGEYREFLRDGGYRRPEFWLSDGWDLVSGAGWSRPLYWREDGSVFTLSGLRAIVDAEPVCHVSYYEADAFARWAGARLPTEFEWEHATRRAQDAAHSGAGAPGLCGRFLEDGRFHPAALSPLVRPDAVGQLLGDVWEWTQSAYLPYPGFRARDGAASEYNGKFMVNQMVLRGGSCATPEHHIRATYRNFFRASARWQFSGIRLARSGAGCAS